METVMDTVAGKLIEFGLLGIIVIVLGVYIIKKDRDHHSERRELSGFLKEANDKMLSAFDRNTTVLTEVKTIIQSITHR
jgi:hypothetical protein